MKTLEDVEPTGNDPRVPLRDGIALLWSYSKPHLRTLLLGLLFGLIAVASTLATPVTVKWVLDSFKTNLEISRPVSILIVLLIVGTIAGFTQTVLLGRLSEQIVLNARRGLIQRLFRSKLPQVQRFRTGDLVTRVTNDTMLLRESTTESFVHLISGAGSLIGTVVLMAVLDWPLLLSTLATLLVVGTLFGLLMPQIGRADKRTQDAIGELGATLESGVHALRSVKSSRAETRQIDKVTTKAREAASHSVRSIWYVATAGAVAGAGVQFAIIVIIGLGAGRASSGDLAVSTLVAFLLYAFNLVEPIATLTRAFTTLQAGLAAAARIRETEHLELENVNACRGELLPPISDPGSPTLALRNVTARYSDSESTALHGVTIEIPRTGHVAIVGPSGAGKTTVFSLLLRFLDPTSGHLELDGVPYKQMSIDEVRSRIGYVEQDTPIIQGSVRENVLLRADADATDAEAWEALAAVRLDHKIRSLPGEIHADVTNASLSGGERQRLAVARALVRRPAILLLDEVTAQLDGITEAAIQQLISEAASTGTVVTIAHRLSTVLDADRIIILDSGRVRDCGVHNELLERDKLYREYLSALRIQSDES